MLFLCLQAFTRDPGDTLCVEADTQGLPVNILPKNVFVLHAKWGFEKKVFVCAADFTEILSNAIHLFDDDKVIRN